MPAIVGTLAVATAASGAVALPDDPAMASFGSSQALTLLPERPQATTPPGTAISTVVAAQQSLGQESTESARAAHEAVVIEERKKAAERAARAQREARRWVLPVSANFRISATFGSSGRMWSDRHTGLDFDTAYGVAVRSVSSGTIVDAGWAGAYGYRVIVRHWDGTETWYAHLSRIVRRSGSVATGEIIGRVGSTGNSTGSHLHFEVHPDGGNAVNPLTWLRRRGLDI